MNPQHYANRIKYRPPASWYRRLNKFGVLLTSIGLGPRDAVALTVAGRTTGRPRRIPILKTTVAGSDYLVSLAGEAEWVRNVRHASGRVTIRRGWKRSALLEEAALADRTDIIIAYLAAAERRSSDASYAKQVRFYFGLGPDFTRDEVSAIAEHYPVFRVTYEP